MKRLLWAWLALLISASGLHAQGTVLCNPPNAQIGTQPGTCVGTWPDITAASATVLPMDISQAPVSIHTISWNTTGSPSSFSISIYGSTDGSAAGSAITTSTTAYGTYTWTGSYVWIGIAVTSLSSGRVKVQYVGSTPGNAAGASGLGADTYVAYWKNPGLLSGDSGFRYNETPTAPTISLVESDQAANGKWWANGVNGGVLTRSVCSDTGTGCIAFETVTRSGLTVATIAGTATTSYTFNTPLVTIGAIGTTTGDLALSNGAASGATWTLESAATTAWKLTGKATAPAQGDLFTFSNATGQMASVADVAVNQVLTSGGVGAVPVYSGTPQLSSLGLGAVAGAAGTLTLGNADTQMSRGAATTFYFGNGSTNDNVALLGDVTHRIGTMDLTTLSMRGGNISFNTTGRLISVGSKTALDENGTLALGSARLIQWNATDAYNGTPDSGFARNAAGIVEVNSGTAGTLRDLVVRKYIDSVDAIGTVGASATVDVTLGATKTLTSTASTNMTLTPSAAGTATQIMTFIITSDATGGDVVTFASTFKPTGPMTLTASKVHTIVFKANGSFWYELSRATGL